MLSRVPSLRRLPFLRFGVVLALAFGGVCALPGAPLAAPIEREIMDIFGRSVRVRIVAVSETTLTIERLGDQVRFDLLIDNLSDQDRQFARELFVQVDVRKPTLLPGDASGASASPPPASLEALPDTPWLERVRRDFRILDRSTGRLIPPPADYWPTQRWFIIRVSSSLPTPGASSSKYNLKSHRPETTGILFVYSYLSERDEPLEKFAAQLPPGAAMLSREAFEAMRKITADPCKEFREQWFREKSARQTSGGALYYRPTEAELAPLHRRLLRRLPDYWPCVPDVSGAYPAVSSSLQFDSYVHSRDGAPARFRGILAAGTFRETVIVTGSKQDELR